MTRFRWVFCAFGCATLADVATAKLPPPWDLFYKIDSEYNNHADTDVNETVPYQVPPEDREQELYLVEASDPGVKTNFEISPTASPEGSRWPPNLIPILKSKFDALAKKEPRFKAAFKISKVIKAARLQSRNTWIVWDEAAPHETPVMVKFNSDAAFSRTNSEITTGILHDEYDPTLKGTVLEESISNGIVLGDAQWHYTIRSLTPYKRPLKENEVMLPVHGLLDLENPLNNAGFNFTDEQKHAWFENQFLPSLAEALANFNFKYGLLPEAHGQNLLVIVDKVTGEVRDIVFRDMFDMAHAPQIRVLRELLHAGEKAKGQDSMSELFHSHVHGGISDSPSGDDILREFTFKELLNVNPFSPTADQQARFRDLFSHAYWDHALKILGMPPETRPQGVDPTNTFDELYSRLVQSKLGREFVPDEHANRKLTLIIEGGKYSFIDKGVTPPISKYKKRYYLTAKGILVADKSGRLLALLDRVSDEDMALFRTMPLPVVKPPERHPVVKFIVHCRDAILQAIGF